jgi:hypothetical protein
MNAIMRIEVPAMEITLIASSHTTSSICFNVVSLSPNLGARNQIGCVDVHYPCAQHIRLFIRAVLPERLLNRDALEQLGGKIKAALEIPPDETMEIDACSRKTQVGLSHSTDHMGRPGRIETTRRFKPPDRKH